MASSSNDADKMDVVAEPTPTPLQRLFWRLLMVEVSRLLPQALVKLRIVPERAQRKRKSWRFASQGRRTERSWMRKRSTGRTSRC